MGFQNHRILGFLCILLLSGLLILVSGTGDVSRANQPTPGDLATEYAREVQPLVKQYCLGCHSTKAKKGSLDLERFATLDLVRKDLKPWQQMIEMLEAGEMPPKEKPQPSAAEQKRLIAWIKSFMDSEARARAGDPGRVPLRRLSNAEYDATIRDLTGVDLRPTREFPADGAAGEGFTNAAEALTDISPALLTKYLNAAKGIADNAVLLPDGFRFSPNRTRRDWTDESIAKLRAFYAEFAPEGRLPLQPYLTATIRHRDTLMMGKTTTEEVARKEKLNPKYLSVLWKALTDKTPSHPLDAIRARWRQATEKETGALAAEVAAWQAALWNTVPIGSYRYGNVVRQVANDPVAGEAPSLRLGVKPTPGQNEVVLYLVTRDLFSTEKGGHAIWSRPRFEATGKPPLLLKDYAQFGPSFEVDFPSMFADTSKYLTATAEVAHERKQSVEELANKHKLDAVYLKRWIEVLAIEPLKKVPTDPEKLPKGTPALAVELLDDKMPANDKTPAIKGWRRKAAELPILLSNASDKVERIPGTVPPHKVVCHPTPKEFVAVVWKSPVAGTVRVTARVTHAHPTCGNGVAWWLEHRRGERAFPLGEGAIDLGGESKPPTRTLAVEKGDQLLLAVDARSGNHFCDLTEIALTVTETDKPARVWDLADDVANTILDANPHADRHGNKDVWSFVKGPSKATSGTPASAPFIPSGSILGR